MNKTVFLYVEGLIWFFLLPPPEHQNYFGVDDNLGPVAVSIRRERLDEGKEKDGMQYNYRVTFRTSQVTIKCRYPPVLLCSVLNTCIIMAA